LVERSSADPKSKGLNPAMKKLSEKTKFGKGLMPCKCDAGVNVIKLYSFIIDDGAIKTILVVYFKKLSKVVSSSNSWLSAQLPVLTARV